MADRPWQVENRRQIEIAVQSSSIWEYGLYLKQGFEKEN